MVRCSIGQPNVGVGLGPIRPPGRVLSVANTLITFVGQCVLLFVSDSIGQPYVECVWSLHGRFECNTALVAWWHRSLPDGAKTIL